MIITRHRLARSSPHVFPARWLILGCCALALMTGIETYGFAQTGILTGTLTISLCIMCALCTLILPLKPDVLTWPLLTMALILDFLYATSPSGIFLAVMLVIVLQAYQSPVLGFLAASFPFAASLYVALQEGGYLIWILSTIIQYAVWYYSMAFFGQWARKRAELAALRQREQQRNIREHIQRRLHDAAANDLTYLIAMIDYHLSTEQSPAQQNVLHEISNVANNALQETRQAINVLENDDDQTGISLSNNVSTKNELLSIVARSDQQLHELGFRGNSSINASTEIDITHDVETLLSSFVREIYGNILKYAEPTAYYAVAIRITPDEIIITASDVPRRSPFAQRESTYSSQSGLRRHSETITRMGGTVELNNSETEWQLAARIPTHLNTD